MKTETQWATYLTMETTGKNYNNKKEIRWHLSIQY